MPDAEAPTYPPDQPTMTPPATMTVGRLLTELAGEPVGFTVELAIVDHAGVLLYVVPLASNDAWWIRGSNLVRFVGRLPREWTEPGEASSAEIAAQQAATVETAGG